VPFPCRSANKAYRRKRKANSAGAFPDSTDAFLYSKKAKPGGVITSPCRPIIFPYAGRNIRYATCLKSNGKTAEK
jgi:hypothetical protein